MVRNKGYKTHNGLVPH